MTTGTQQARILDLLRIGVEERGDEVRVGPGRNCIVGASKQVRELEQLGYVERVVGRGDQRTRTVVLTARGRAALEAGRRARADVEAEVFALVGSDHVAAPKTALAGLLIVAGLDDHVRTRTVPTHTT